MCTKNTLACLGKDARRRPASLGRARLTLSVCLYRSLDHWASVCVCYARARLAGMCVCDAAGPWSPTAMRWASVCFALRPHRREHSKGTPVELRLARRRRQERAKRDGEPTAPARHHRSEDARPDCARRRRHLGTSHPLGPLAEWPVTYLFLLGPALLSKR